jgi:hypothetical protein
MCADIPIAELLKAIGIYLEVAYPPESERRPPAECLNLSPTMTMDELTDLPFAEEMSGSMLNGVARTVGCTLRLGSGFFPYMKLVVRSTDEPPGWMLAVDAHDSIDQKLLKGDRVERHRLLKLKNRELGRAILQAWEDAGLPTHRSIILGGIMHPQPARVGDSTF